MPLMTLKQAFTLDTRSLALCRMGLGAILCTDALLRTRDFTLMFAPDGMFPPDLVARSTGAGAWSVAMLLDASWWGGIVLASEGIAGACLAAGAATRWATVIAWVALVSVLRRTPLATNAGDFWLATLLLWSIFLPLGAAWSVDARRSRRRQPVSPKAAAIVSWGTVSFVLQIVAVYISAGAAKCNESWWSGDAVAQALSVHDHGTRLGAWLASMPWLTRCLTWATMALETLGPLLLLACPRPAVRLAIVASFILFHLAICGVMTVGLFGYLGMAVWLALIPSAAWAWLGLPPAANVIAGFRARGSSLCVSLLAIAIIAFVHDNTSWRGQRLPPALDRLVNGLCLHQSWGMFGSVPRQQQWVYTRAALTDGRIVDVLRGGRPVETEQPTDGFLSLPNHRWHRLFWELPRPAHMPFAPSVAAALVRKWNAAHGVDGQIVSMELRFARLGTAATDDTLLDHLLAAWPPRDATGAGNLDRLLQEGPSGRVD
jgi:hypothetical protein